MVLPKSRIHFALGNSVGKGKATENLILKTSQGQSLKLTTSSHCEPLSGFHSCGCDLLTCLIPSGGSPIFQSYPVLWAALHTMAFHQGHCSSNQQLQRHSDLARHCNNRPHRRIVDLEKYTTVTKREDRLIEKAEQARGCRMWWQNSRKVSHMAIALDKAVASQCSPLNQQEELAFEPMEGL